MRKLIFATAILLLTLIANGEAGGPPPIELMDGSVAMAPAHAPGQTGPAIGILGQPYSNQGVEGVLVQSDRKKRELWYLDKNKRRVKVRFSPGNDVILKVNGEPVKSSTDVLENTFDDWNSLTIKDLSTGRTDKYWVYLRDEQ